MTLVKKTLCIMDAMPSGKIIIFILFLIITGIFFINYQISQKQILQPKINLTTINVSGKEKVKYPQDFTTVLLGDSMTEYLGNSVELRSYLSKYYPDKTFEFLNYGFGSTNILSAEKRLTEETFHGRIFRPILDIDFDLILIESFGHNPLSEFSLEEGLKKQTESLDKIVKLIKESNPQAKIVFVATISPNKSLYALRQVELSKEKRVQWANERIAYIKNHIKYAKDHHIPLVNVYEKSLDEKRDGQIKYISETDYIHPSPKGIYLISEEIAKFIFENNILN